MVQIINDPYKGGSANIFGRIGTGIGKGLAETVPKEIERGRLAQGLQQFEQESANLTPMQQLARLSAIPGITPQQIQSFGELAKQQARGTALKGTQGPSKFPVQGRNVPNSDSNKFPSITQETPLEHIQEGYIPPTQDQIIQDAGRRYNENPELFGHDPQKAIDMANQSALTEKEINEAYLRQHENLNKIQENVISGLRLHSQQLGAGIVPADVYSKIEDEAIQAVKPKNKGGKGLTEQQAKKELGAKLDQIARDYQGIQSIGNWGITGRKASETLRSLKSLQSKFEKRGDTENFANKLISENKLSPINAFAIAEPVSSNKDLKNELQKIPAFERSTPGKEGVKKRSAQYKTDKSLEVAEKLFPFLGTKGSPLAVAYELQKKGYDPQTWLNYVDQHRDELQVRQARQLDNPQNLIPTWNDWWLSSWTGLE